LSSRALNQSVFNSHPSFSAIRAILTRLFSSNVGPPTSINGLLAFCISDIASLINSTLRISTPLVFAAMAGIFAERSGVIDFSLEGKMLMAAFVAAVGSYYLGNP